MFGGMSMMEESAIFWGEALTRSADRARLDAREARRLARAKLKDAEKEVKRTRLVSELFIHTARDLRKLKARTRKGGKRRVANGRS